MYQRRGGGLDRSVARGVEPIAKKEPNAVEYVIMERGIDSDSASECSAVYSEADLVVITRPLSGSVDIDRRET